MTLIDLPTGLDLAGLRNLAAGPKPSPEATALPDGKVPAISYLRVSTKDQATRNGLEEGLSIPAQRDAAQRKADQLNAVIVAEFIEPGESGKTAHRKALQEMLDYLAEHPVRYCIINKVDRIARNRLDDAIIHATLRQAGVTLVSVMENIDETPSGMLMHGIMASIAEFYSLNLAQEVTKGLVQKATIGGTPHRAPIGYLNIRTVDAGGREVREVRIDPDRAEHIRFAFTSYATGDCSLSRLARELETRGLTTRPTPSFPAKPVTTTALHKILTNPYYQGIVTFRDVTYPGTHDPLVTPETFEQVQTILQQNHIVGDKPQKHDHYLKGSIYCTCGKKLMFERPRNHQGVTYDYFTCTGRRLGRNNCQRTASLTHRVEQAIETGYQGISLSPDEAAQIQDVLGHVFDALAETTSDEQKLLAGQKAKLEAEQVKLLQAHYADAIPLDLLKTEQDRIRANLQAITGQLDTLETTYDKAKVGLDAILGLLTDIGDVYAKAEPSERRMLNRALFDRITIDDEDQATLEPTETIQTILTTNPRPHNERTLPRNQAGQGSNVQLYVDAGGLKPNTWQRLERLSSAWNQAKLVLGDQPDGAADDEPGVVVNPRRRARTPLTESQVDAIRTARANGESVVSICQRFNVHRMTVWTHTRDLF
ncbi:recombinase family protein [Microbacterium lacticum]